MLDAPAWDQAFEDLLRPHLPLLPADEPLGAELSLRAAGLDSLGTVNLLMDVEDTFGVEVPDDDLSFEVFATPSTLWQLVDRLRAEQA